METLRKNQIKNARNKNPMNKNQDFYQPVSKLDTAKGKCQRI